MSEHEAPSRAEVLLATACPGIVGNPYIPVFPFPKQAAFLSLDCREALYGGAAMGAKTWALMMCALQYVDEPEYAALLLRRTYPELARAKGLIELGHKWLGGKGPVWSEQRKMWTFPRSPRADRITDGAQPGGATLSFAAIPLRKDLEKLEKGGSFNLLGFDELTTFPEAFYRRMFSRLRRTEGQGRVPSRVRGATNPGGEGHAWVKARFGLPLGGRAGRVFVGARLEDNKAADSADYRESLAELDPVTLARMLEGNWDVEDGGTFIDRTWFPPPIPIEAVPKDVRWGRGWDCAGSTSSRAKYTAGVRMGRSPSTGRFYISDVIRFQRRPAERDAQILAVAQGDGRGTMIVIEQEPADAGIKQADDQIRMLAGYDVTAEPATKAKLVRATPFARQVQRQNVLLCEGPWVGAFLDECQGAGDDSDFLDQVDAAALIFNRLAVVGTPSATTIGKAAPDRPRLGRWSSAAIAHPLRRPGVGRR